MSDYQPTTADDLPLFAEPELSASTLTAEDRERFENQADYILAILKTRTVTTSELADICCNYRARVSELRQQGHTIKCRRGAGGNNFYELVTGRD